MTTTDELCARLFLLRAAEPPAPAVYDYVAVHGPVETADHIRGGTAPSAVLAEITRPEARIEHDLRAIENGVARLLTPEDDDWPVGRLSTMGSLGAPLALWVRGEASLTEFSGAAVALTGTRMASGYGTAVAADFGYDLARVGVTVVSGGSLGVDEAARRAALTADGRTVVVLPCGVNETYPQQHARLYDAAVERGGLLVSEYPTCALAVQARLAARRRLLVALTSATVIIEAGQRSGALATRPSRQRTGPTGLRRARIDLLHQLEGRQRAAAHRRGHGRQLRRAHQLPGGTAMNAQDQFQTALAGLQLPVEWQVAVVIRPRRRSVGIEVQPGGGVAILIPPTADPEQVARFVRGHRRWITEKVDTATRLAPDHPVKEFVDGEEYDLLGQRYQLHLVDTPPAGVEQLPAGTADHVLYVRRQRPEQVRRAIIGLYRQEGLAWAKREGLQYEQDGQIEGLRYTVRDLGRLRWGAYYGPPKHTTTLHWAVFGLPMPLIEYVLVHERAHATRPGGRAHGSAWQQRMNRWMPDWQQRKTELAEAGRHCWLGDHKPLGLSE